MDSGFIFKIGLCLTLILAPYTVSGAAIDSPKTVVESVSANETAPEATSQQTPRIETVRVDVQDVFQKSAVQHPTPVPEEDVEKFWEYTENSLTQGNQEPDPEPELTSFWEELTQSLVQLARDAVSNNATDPSLWYDLEDGSSRVVRQAGNQKTVSSSSVSKVNSQDASRVRRQVKQQYATAASSELSLSQLWEEIEKSVSKAFQEADSSDLTPSSRVRRAADQDLEKAAPRMTRQAEYENEEDITHLWHQFEQHIARVARDLGFHNTTNLWEHMDKVAPVRAARNTEDHSAEPSPMELWREFRASVTNVSHEVGLSQVWGDWEEEAPRVAREANLKGLVNEWQKFLDHMEEIAQQGELISSDSENSGTRVARETGSEKRALRKARDVSSTGTGVSRVTRQTAPSTIDTRRQPAPGGNTGGCMPCFFDCVLNPPHGSIPSNIPTTTRAPRMNFLQTLQRTTTPSPDIDISGQGSLYFVKCMFNCAVGVCLQSRAH